MQKSVIGSLRSFAFGMAMLVVAGSLQAANEQIEFDVPAGDAATTLRMAAGQARVQLVFMVDVVRGETTQAIRGPMPVRVALERMLEGTRLALVQDRASLALSVRSRPVTGSLAGRIFNPDTGDNLERARVSVEGSPLEAYSDDRGHYRLEQIPAGTMQVRAFYTGSAEALATVAIRPGETVRHNFELSPAKKKTP